MEDRQIVIGGFYRHFKDKLYQVKGTAIHSETKEKMVIYQGLYGDYEMYVRPYDMFMSEVDREKYPDIKQKYRFEKYTEKQMIDILWNCYSKTGTFACTKTLCRCIVITNNNSIRFQRFYSII